MFSGIGFTLIKFSGLTFFKSFKAWKERGWSNSNPKPNASFNWLFILLYSPSLLIAALYFFGFVSAYASVINALSDLSSNFSKPEPLKLFNKFL